MKDNQYEYHGVQFLLRFIAEVIFILQNVFSLLESITFNYFV